MVFDAGSVKWDGDKDQSAKMLRKENVPGSCVVATAPALSGRPSGRTTLSSGLVRTTRTSPTRRQRRSPDSEDGRLLPLVPRPARLLLEEAFNTLLSPNALPHQGPAIRLRLSGA